MRKVLIAPLALLAAACNQGAAQDSDWQPRDVVTIEHPEWSRDAVLYQINTRHFTPEGTFTAAQEELPRLK